MSNLKQFTSRIENASSGEIISAPKNKESFYNSLGYLKCDGSVLLQSAYPNLYQKIGLLPAETVTAISSSVSGTSNNINEVLYANNTYMYVAAGGSLGTSSNGVTWTTRTSGTSNNIVGLAYGNNRFIYIDNQGHVANSVDNGVNWTRSSSIIPPITYVGGNTFTRLGSASTTSIPLTGLSGGASSAPQAGDIVIIGVASGDSAQRSLAVSGYTQLASLFANDSNDTNLWVGWKLMDATPDTSVTIPATAVGSGQTVAINVWRNIDVSAFAVTTAIDINTARIDPPVATTTKANSVLLMIGAGALGTGAAYTASYLSNFLSVFVDDNTDSVIGVGSITRPTPGGYDGELWGGVNVSGTDSCAIAIIELKTFFSTNTLIYANNTFVAAGDGGFLTTSSDAITWTRRNLNSNVNINAVAYGDNKFVFGGNFGTIGTSSNGVNWTVTTNAVRNPLTYVGGKIQSRFGSVSSLTTNLTLTGGTNSSPQPGDVVFAAVSAARGNANTATPITGYTQLASIYVNNLADDGYGTPTGYDTNLWVGYKIMGTTPDTTITFPGSGDASHASVCSVQVWRGLNIDDLLDASVVTDTVGAATLLVNPNPITTSTANSVLLVVGAGAGVNDVGTSTYTASYLSNFLTTSSNDSSDSVMGFGSILLSTPQTYDPAAWTCSVASSILFSSGSVVIALRETSEINTLKYVNSQFVLGGAGGLLATSPNASTWTLKTPQYYGNINSLATYSDGLYVFGGNSGAITTSSNRGNTWVLSSSPTSNNINSLTNNNGFYVGGGNSGTIVNFSEYDYNSATEFTLPTFTSNNFDLYIKT